MAKGILGLEVSAQEIRYVYLEKRQRGFILSKSGRFSNPSPTISEDPANLTSVIQNFLAQEKISTQKIFLCLSGEDLLLHQVNLPRMPEEELNEVIRGEIERVPRFSNQEFDYIYTSFKLDEQKLRILLCALPKNNLDNYIQGVQNTGITLESLEVSPLNFLEVLYNRIGKEKAEALVVLDSHASFVMVFWQNECKLFFQTAAGKEDLYTSSHQLNSSAFLSWTEDIKRIIKSYQREFGGRVVEKIWFIWDNQNCPDLDDLVAQELGMDVAIPKPEDFNIGLEEKEQAFNPIFLLSLAAPLIYIKGIRQKFNFKHFLRQIKLKKVVRNIGLFVLIYLIIMGSLLGIVTGIYLTANKEILAKEKEALNKVTSLEMQTAELRKERDEYLDIKDRILRQAAFVKMLNRISWSEIFATVSSALPEDVSLSSFKVSESGEVKIEGATFSIDSIAEMIRKIGLVPFLEDAQFDYLRERQAEDKKIVEFGIVTRLKQEAQKTQDGKD